MNFSAALHHLKHGAYIAREGWNGKGMFLYLAEGSTFKPTRNPLKKIVGTDALIEYRPHIDMKTAQGDFVPWVASQTDLLANDWLVVELKEVMKDAYPEAME